MKKVLFQYICVTASVRLLHTLRKGHALTPEYLTSQGKDRSYQNSCISVIDRGINAVSTDLYGLYDTSALLSRAVRSLSSTI